jgi:diamine N-acetyltransferase
MGKIHLQEINDDNLYKVLALSDSLSPYQKKCVAPNAYSLAEAYLSPDIAWPRAIYLDDEPIGFVMLSLKEKKIKAEDQPGHYLWRFMIAQPHQGKGYGSQALDLIKEKCRIDGMKTLYTSCATNGKQPYKFYVDCGFMDTNEQDEGEEVLKIMIR